MARTVPVLGPAGFTTDMVIKADHAMSNFYITLPSQTDIYRGSVTSLGDIIRRYGNDALQVEQEMQRSLTGYLERQFEEVSVSVTAVTHADRIEIQITAILRDGEKNLDLHHVVTATDSKIRSIIDLQNNGRLIIQDALLI